MTAITRDDRISGADAEVNYIWNPPAEPGVTLEFVTEAEERSTMRTLPGRSVWITNARPLTTELDREGFVLVSHASTVADFDLIQEDAAVDQQYIDEMTELLRDVTGAAKAFMLGGGKKRFGESATDKLAPLLNAKPARYPHADNTDASAAGLVDLILQFVDDIEPERYPRYALYNLWRSVSPPPQDFPLAVCDARTIAPADEVTVTAISTERSGDHRPRHHRVPLQPRAPLALLPRHAPRRGARLQGARHRPAPGGPRPAHRVHRSDLPAGHAHEGERRDARARVLRLTRRARTDRQGDNVTLTVDDVVERASALTDVEDPEPKHFAANLEAIVASMNGEAALTPAGVEGMLGMLTLALRNRIEVDRYVAGDPAIDDAVDRGADLPHRAAAFGHDLLPVPVRPGPRTADAAHVGG